MFGPCDKSMCTEDQLGGWAHLWKLVTRDEAPSVTSSCHFYLQGHGLLHSVSSWVNHGASLGIGSRGWASQAGPLRLIPVLWIPPCPARSL